MSNQKLEYIFNNINEWLKYAEVKNGILLTLLLTICGFIFNIETKTPAIIILLFFVVCSLLILLISFTPILTNMKFNNKNQKSNSNVLYFGYLKDSNANEIAKMLKLKKVDKYQNDIISQIIINSNIAYLKYEIFKFTVNFLLIGFIISLIIQITEMF